MSVIARSAPFTPDMKRLKNVIEVGDERTLKNYLKYLEDGKAVTCLSRQQKASGDLKNMKRFI